MSTIPKPPTAASLAELGAVDSGAASRPTTGRSTTVDPTGHRRPPDARTTVPATATTVGHRDHADRRRLTDQRAPAMRAVVLVGGFGTRLRPLTDDIPKPLLPVGQRPIIEHVVRILAARRGDRGGAGARLPARRLRGRLPGRHLRRRPAPLRRRARAARHRRGHRLRRPARPASTTRSSSSTATCSPTSTSARWSPSTGSTGAEATIHLTPVEDPSAFGVVAHRRRGPGAALRGEAAAARRRPAVINAGTYVLRAVDDRPRARRRRVSIERVVFPAMAAEGRLFALVHRRLLDRHRPPRAATARPTSTPSSGRRPHRARAGAWRRTRGSTATVDGQRARRRGRSWRPGPTSAAACCWPGAGSARGAAVIDSVLGPGARGRCRAPCSTTSCSGRGAVVEAGERLANARRPVPA